MNAIELCVEFTHTGRYLQQAPPPALLQAGVMLHSSLIWDWLFGKWHSLVNRDGFELGSHNRD